MLVTRIWDVQEPTPPKKEALRGKDGHLTLSTKGTGNDFFSNAASPTGGGRRQSGDSSRAGSMGGAAPPSAASAATSSVAQTKFGNAKAISSKDFQDANKER